MGIEIFVKNISAENQKQNRGFVCLKIWRGTCYGSPATEISIKYGADKEKVVCEFSEYPKKKNILFEPPVVENFLIKIFEIIEKEEILTDLRSVISYHAEIEWRNLDFINGEKSGKLKLFSNEWHTEQIEEFIQFEAETAEIAERFQKNLDTKPHRHALEIYSAVKDFARKYLM